MGGGEGSAAREVLRHNTVQRVVMCDIDEVDQLVETATLVWISNFASSVCIIAAYVRVPNTYGGAYRRWWTFAGRT